jgi:hypothetical protein
MIIETNDGTAHISPNSIEIGDFRVEGGYLTAVMNLVLCDRDESLVLYVEPLGDKIGIAVYEAMLDYSSLAAVAEQVAAKLNTTTGRAALAAIAAGGYRQLRRWLPQVRVRLSLGGKSNG